MWNEWVVFNLLMPLRRTSTRTPRKYPKDKQPKEPTETSLQTLVEIDNSSKKYVHVIQIPTPEDE